jgi:hypothetical protein
MGITQDLYEGRGHSLFSPLEMEKKSHFGNVVLQLFRILDDGIIIEMQ